MESGHYVLGHGRPLKVVTDVLLGLIESLSNAFQTIEANSTDCTKVELLLGLDFAAASESVALEAIDPSFALQRDVAPGEAIFMSMSGEISTNICANNASLTPCIFEYVYFSRPDSVSRVPVCVLILSSILR
jgi:hypothetical protein